MYAVTRTNFENISQGGRDPAAKTTHIVRFHRLSERVSEPQPRGNRGRLVAAGGWGRRGWECLLVGTEFPFGTLRKAWNLIEAEVVQYCVCAKGHGAVHF